MLVSWGHSSNLIPTIADNNVLKRWSELRIEQNGADRQFDGYQIWRKFETSQHKGNWQLHRFFNWYIFARTPKTPRPSPLLQIRSAGAIPTSPLTLSTTAAAVANDEADNDNEADDDEDDEDEDDENEEREERMKGLQHTKSTGDILDGNQGNHRNVPVKMQFTIPSRTLQKQWHLQFSAWTGHISIPCLQKYSSQFYFVVFSPSLNKMLSNLLNNFNCWINRLTLVLYCNGEKRSYMLRNEYH